jgi:hypothetical protein
MAIENMTVVSGRAPTSIHPQATVQMIVARMAPEKISGIEENEKPIADVTVTPMATTSPRWSAARSLERLKRKRATAVPLRSTAHLVRHEHDAIRKCDALLSLNETVVTLLSSTAGLA